MNKKKHIKNRTIVLTAVIGSLLIVAFVMIGGLWNYKTTAEATDEAVSAVSAFYLETMADSHAKTVTNLISSSFDEMRIATIYIADEDVNSEEDLRDAIGKAEALLGMNQLALVDEDNVVYTRYTTYTGGSRHAFLAEDSLSSPVISIVSLYGSSKQLCLAIPTPDLSIMGKNYKACFVQFDTKDIVDLLALDDQGRTHFALYSKNGSNLSGTALGPVISNRNFLDVIQEVATEDKWEETRTNFENNKDGALSFGTGDAHQIVCYTPIEGTDWELAVLIRERIIQDQIRDIGIKNLSISRSLIIYTFLSVLALASILLFQFAILSRDKLEEEKETSKNYLNMANTDSMTGLSNKHAYSEREELINDRITAGETDPLAVVVGDINGLKYINDTLGHAAGDQLIKDAAALLCKKFPDGAIYRVGGDEFVILLQGAAFDTMQESIDDFNHTVESNISKKSVVISIGYSTLKSEDKYLSDVFERADRMMYERKKELKGLGSLSR